jgi:hypothetical protein
VNNILKEAAHISNGTLDLSCFLGCVLGAAFAVFVTTDLGINNLGLLNNAIETTLFGTLASFFSVMIVGIRQASTESKLLDIKATTIAISSVLKFFIASYWAGFVALSCFFLAAFLGYSLGLVTIESLIAPQLIDELLGGYSIFALLHLALRVFVELTIISSLALVERFFIAKTDDVQSRVVTRTFLWMITSLVLIEALDAYVYLLK